MRTADFERIAIAKTEDRGEDEEEEADAMAGILVTMRTRQPERRMAVPVFGIFSRKFHLKVKVAVPVSAKGKQKPAAL